MIPKSDAWPGRSALSKVDALCDSFEAAWKEVPARPQPKLEEFLREQDEARVCFRELFAIELYHCRRLGLPIDRPGYVSRFPDMTDLIDQGCGNSSENTRAISPAPLELEVALQDSELLQAPQGVTTNHSSLATSLPRKTEAVHVPGYEVGGLLGRGGMGAVFLARQIAFDRLVALKVILSGGTASQAEKDRFRTESLAVARLNHVGIVQIYEAGEGKTETGESAPFLAMEYCAGGSLSAKLRGTPLPPDEACSLVEGVARAVSVAHQADVIHRDLKPQNILLDSAGNTKVADFGLAKLLDQGTQTQSAAILGTPAYMAPEQALDSKRAGPAADVYGLGAILYECLTGRPPFQAPTALEVLVLVEKIDPLPVRRLQPGVPRDLETICLKCLHKEPAKRYTSAEQLAEDLHRYRTGESILARPVSSSERILKWVKRHKALAAFYTVALLAVVLLLGLGFWFSWMIGTERSKADAEKALREAADVREKASQLLGHVGHARAKIARRRPGWTWSALEDLGLASNLPANDELRAELRIDATECLTSLDVRPVGSVAEGLAIWSLAWSPDGKYLAVGQRAVNILYPSYTIQLIESPPSTGARELVAPQKSVKAGVLRSQDAPLVICYSPDSRYLAAGSRSGWVHCWDLSKPSNSPLWSQQGHETLVKGLCFSNDGRSLFSGGGQKVQRLDVATGKSLASFNVGRDVFGLAIHPHDGWVAVSGERLARLNAWTLQPLGPDLAFNCNQIAFAGESAALLGVSNKEVHVHGLDSRGVLRTISPPEGAKDLSAMDRSANGRLLLTAADDQHARLWDLLANRLIATVPFEGGAGKVAIAPSGSTFAVCDEKRVRLYEVGGLVEQTYLAGHLERPTLSFCFAQDGQSFAAESHHQERWSRVRVWRKDATGQLLLRTRQNFVNSESGDKLRLALSPLGGLAVAPRKGLAEVGYDQYPTLDPPMATVQDLYDMCYDPLGRLWLADRDVVSVRDRQALPLGGRAMLVAIADLCAGGGTAPVQAALDCLRIGELKGVSQTTHRGGIGVVLTGKPGVKCLAPGQRWTVAGCRDGSLLHLEVKDEKLSQLGVAPLSKGELTALALSPNESLAIAGSAAGELFLVSLPELTKLGTLNFHEDGVSAVRSASNGWWASGDKAGLVIVWKFAGQETRELFTFRHSRPVRDLHFGSDGGSLHVLIEGEYGIRVYHLDALQQKLNTLGLGCDFDAPIPSPASESAVQPPPVEPTQPIGKNGLRLEVYRGEISGGRPRVHYEVTPGRTYTGLPHGSLLKWSGWLRPPKAGRYLLSAPGKDMVKLYLEGVLLADVLNATAQAEIELEAKPYALTIEQIAWEGVGGLELSWLPAGEKSAQPIPCAYLFQTREAAEQAKVPTEFVCVEEAAPVPQQAGRTNALAFSKDGLQLAVGKRADTCWAEFVDVGENKTRHTTKNVSGHVLDFSPDHKTWLVRHQPKKVKLYDSTSSEPLADFKADGAILTHASLWPTGKSVLGVTADILYLWDIERKDSLQWHKESADIFSVISSHDAQSLFLIRGNTTARVIEKRHPQNFEKVWSVALAGKCLPNQIVASADGSTLVVGDTVKGITLLEAASGKILQSWTTDHASPPLLAISADGKRIVSSDDGFRVWDRQGHQLARFGLGANWRCLALSADGLRLAVAGNSNHPVRLFKLSPP